MWGKNLKREGVHICLYSLSMIISGSIFFFFLWVHLCCCKWHYFIFYGCITFPHIYSIYHIFNHSSVDVLGFPGGSVVKNPPANAGDAGDTGSVPGLGRSPGGGNGNPFQYSCLGNPMDRRAWGAIVPGVSKSQI